MNKLPEKWYCLVTNENKATLDKWRRSVAKSHLDYEIEAGYSILSKHPTDASYYYTGNVRGPSKFDGYVLITTDDFIKLVSKDGGVDKQITPSNAQRIIDAACAQWKTKLACMWGSSIVLGNSILVERGFYTEMRNNCTDAQNVLFDEIFGRDIKHLPEGTPCLVRDTLVDYWKLAYASGDGRFYSLGGSKTEMWKCYRVLDVDNLPKT